MGLSLIRLFINIKFNGQKTFGDSGLLLFSHQTGNCCIVICINKDKSYFIYNI